jgi:hypothetical protein
MYSLLYLSLVYLSCTLVQYTPPITIQSNLDIRESMQGTTFFFSYIQVSTKSSFFYIEVQHEGPRKFSLISRFDCSTNVSLFVFQVMVVAELRVTSTNPSPPPPVPLSPPPRVQMNEQHLPLHSTKVDESWFGWRGMHAYSLRISNIWHALRPRSVMPTTDAQTQVCQTFWTRVAGIRRSELNVSGQHT